MIYKFKNLSAKTQNIKKIHEFSQLHHNFHVLEKARESFIRNYNCYGLKKIRELPFHHHNYDFLEKIREFSLPF